MARTRGTRRARRERRLAQRSRDAMRALTAGALSLPGLGHGASAESAPLEIRSDYRYSRYAEDPLPSSNLAAGSEDRYEIDIHQFSFEAPLGDALDLGIDINHETMSGASPWYVTPGASPGDDPEQVMTAATISETRTDALVSGRFYGESTRTDIAGGFSVENDYQALNLSLGVERDFDEKHTTLSGGIGGSFDDIEPSDTDQYPERVRSEKKETYDVFVGLSQVIGRSTTAQTSVKLAHATGFLSDPYKQAFVVSAPLSDARPDDRNQLAWLTRLRHHFGRVDGTVHLDYQYYVDDWEINSHTLELAWYQQLFERVSLIPSLRYYSQSQAYFYAPFYTSARSDGLRSSDYRLSPFGALSYRLEAEAKIHTGDFAWLLTAGWERYTSRADLALGSVSVENPGLVSYELYTVGLSARF